MRVLSEEERKVKFELSKQYSLLVAALDEVQSFGADEKNREKVNNEDVALYLIKKGIRLV
jgi:hypothetical protein